MGVQKRAGVAELVDATDSKSVSFNRECGFKSLLRHWLTTEFASVIFILMTGAFLFFGPFAIEVSARALGHSERRAVEALGVDIQPDESAKQEEPEESTKPKSVQDQGERDESDLPAEAFNPMKLYEINADGDASAVLIDGDPPTIDPNEEGVIRWRYLTVNVKKRYIDIEGVIGINEGFLEQVVCLPGTRGYESLVIGFARPSHIHAALLLLGLEQGKPGKWVAIPPKTEDANWTYQVVPPKGAKVRVTIIYEKIATDVKGLPNQVEAKAAEAVERVETDLKPAAGGNIVEVPVREWVVDYRDGKLFPDGPWVFGGSAVKQDFTDTERYIADLTGSIMGIVTFGDEILGWNEVWPDQDEALEPEWVCNTKVMPAWNTRVVVRLRPWVEAGNAENGPEDGDENAEESVPDDGGGANESAHS